MQSWLMFDCPGILILYALGYAGALWDKCRQVTKDGRLTWLGGAAVLGAAAWLILMGASLWEAAAWLMAFLLMIMGVKE